MFKVSVENVKVYNHPNAEALDLVGIGESQYVVQKGLYKNGDKAVAVPKGALLTHPLLLTEWEKYLQGSEKNVVGFVILRGQESQGIVIREDILSQLGHNINDFEVGQDISELLGITKYVPKVPDELRNTVEVYRGSLEYSNFHDCKYASVYLDKFVEGEPIEITSKIDGSQINIICVQNERTVISSKGLWDDGLVFKEDADNIYTKAWNNFIRNPNNLLALLHSYDEDGKDIFDQQLQIVGEVVPAIKGFSYSYTKPTLLIYKIVVNGKTINLDLFRQKSDNVVPLLHTGTFSQDTLALATELAEQNTCPLDNVTINEGVVISNGKHCIKVKNTNYMKKHGTR